MATKLTVHGVSLEIDEDSLSTQSKIGEMQAHLISQNPNMPEDVAHQLAVETVNSAGKNGRSTRRVLDALNTLGLI